MKNSLSYRIVLVSIVLGIGAATVYSEPTEPAEQEMTALDAWKIMRQGDVGSERFVEARSRLEQMIEDMTPEARLAAATSLMDQYADDYVNAAAIELFGPDPFPSEGIREMVFNSGRGAKERTLIRTYFNLCQAEYRESLLSEEVREQLVAMLADRLQELSGEPTVTYGEQRLLTHFCQAMLSRYGSQPDSMAKIKNLREAMENYAQKADLDQDVLAWSIRGWEELMGQGNAPPNSVYEAVHQLGYWEPLRRWVAAQYLARRVGNTPEAREAIWKALNDPRDEVRAAAAIALSEPGCGEPQQVVGKLVEVLTRDRGVIVQRAASMGLRSESENAASAIAPLLAAFDPESDYPLPGASRANNILYALSGLVAQASPEQQQEMLSLAVRNLDIAPAGSLELLKSLGPKAASAVNALKEYRDRADRSQRQYIERHVLPAINAPTVLSQTP